MVDSNLDLVALVFAGLITIAWLCKLYLFHVRTKNRLGGELSLAPLLIVAVLLIIAFWK